MPRTHDATKDGPPPKKPKKTTTPSAAPVEITPQQFSPELMAQMIQALEEKKSAEKAKKEKELKKKKATPRKKLGKTPPKPTVSNEEVWDDDSDGEDQPIQPFNMLGSIAENAASVGNLNDDFPVTGFTHGITFDGKAQKITTRAGAERLSQSQSGTKQDDKPEDGPEEDSKEDEVTKLGKELNSLKAKINSKIGKYHTAIEKQGQRNEAFQKDHLKLKEVGEQNNSSELLTFRSNFLEMMSKFQDKLAEATWEEEYEKKNQLTQQMEKHTRTESALHTLANFLRTAAQYIDSKNVAADEVRAEIRDLRAKYDDKFAKKAQLEKEKWDLQAPLDDVP